MVALAPSSESVQWTSGAGAAGPEAAVGTGRSGATGAGVAGAGTAGGGRRFRIRKGRGSRHRGVIAAPSPVGSLPTTVSIMGCFAALQVVCARAEAGFRALLLGQGAGGDGGGMGRGSPRASLARRVTTWTAPLIPLERPELRFAVPQVMVALAPSSERTHLAMTLQRVSTMPKGQTPGSLSKATSRLDMRA